MIQNGLLFTKIVDWSTIYSAADTKSGVFAWCHKHTVPNKMNLAEKQLDSFISVPD
jgi:hypothetical protein